MNENGRKENIDETDHAKNEPGEESDRQSREIEEEEKEKEKSHHCSTETQNVKQ